MRVHCSQFSANCEHRMNFVESHTFFKLFMSCPHLQLTAVHQCHMKQMPRRTGGDHRDVLVLRGWRLSSRTWNPITSPWITQLMWLGIVHSGDWCLRLALRTPSDACHKSRKRKRLCISRHRTFLCLSRRYSEAVCLWVSPYDLQRIKHCYWEINATIVSYLRPHIGRAYTIIKVSPISTPIRLLYLRYNIQHWCLH